ncbi:MAG: hypothetical protein Q8L34_03360 [Candidatus Woesearchaeota archaeon]|nr:hypothetical protein [Candidatus Woesearchaeota archaeon]
MKVSNQLLVVLLVLALLSIVTSIILILERLGAPGFLTGLATFDTGVVNVTISATTDINFIEPANVDFGSGTLVSSSVAGVNTSLNTSDPAWGGGANPSTFAEPGPFTVRNDGNTEVNLSVNSSNTAATFIGGTSPGYYFVPSPTGTGRDGCGGDDGNNITAWNSTLTAFSSTAVTICENLTFSDNGDEINISIFIDIPYDATTGLKTDSGFEVHAGLFS